MKTRFWMALKGSPYISFSTLTPSPAPPPRDPGSPKHLFSYTSVLETSVFIYICFGGVLGSKSAGNYIHLSLLEPSRIGFSYRSKRKSIKKAPFSHLSNAIQGPRSTGAPGIARFCPVVRHRHLGSKVYPLTRPRLNTS